MVNKIKVSCLKCGNFLGARRIDKERMDEKYQFQCSKCGIDFKLSFEDINLSHIFIDVALPKSEAETAKILNSENFCVFCKEELKNNKKDTKKDEPCNKVCSFCQRTYEINHT